MLLLFGLLGATYAVYRRIYGLVVKSINLLYIYVRADPRRCLSVVRITIRMAVAMSRTEDEFSSTFRVVSIFETNEA